ncbi:MAG: hypothetical protein COA76_05045 [Moritella sp.]|uniref:hypothetical protein n=1 Tax=Moritella sp. TaxID=78556 RepID=UPI000C11DF56|nr:hypothetical protein [Moritella sp.]MBL1415846.1 hypothetical protein [Moritella sp.]PHR89148.1 MAG: hypothetical protein COA76_05045 [Moritella sp.]
MKFTITAYAGEFGCAPQSFYTVLSGQAPRIDLTELAPYTQFKPAKQVAFTQSVLADNRVDRWQILINTALENSNLIESSKHAPLLMVLPFVDAKFSEMQAHLIESVADILPAWTTHPNSQYYLLGSAGFYQALRQADVLLSDGMELVVIGAVDSWATEQGLLKFVSQFSDYSSVVLPASEGAVFVVLSRQAQGLEVLSCGMDVVIDRHTPSGLIALIADSVAKQTAPMQYLSLCHSGDESLDQVGHNTLSAISGLFDANTQFFTPQIIQGDIGACYSLLHFLVSYHHYKQHIWQGTSLQIDTSSLPYVGTATYRWFD